MRNLRLEQIMKVDLVRVKPDDTMEHVATIFEQSNFHHLPVTDDDENLVGIISTTDLNQISYGMSLFERQGDKDMYNHVLFRSLLVNEVMKKDVFTLGPDATITDAHQAFKEGRYRAIPIVSNEMLVGLVTPFDLIELLMDEVVS